MTTENQTVSLTDFRENPNNPSKATEEEIERLAGKLKRVPLGLTAIRIAYVTDKGGKMVISGNKRLRVLKRLYGENGNVPAEWVQDVTAMSEAERHEFIVSANVSDGEWDIDKLLAQYGEGELNDLMGAENVAELLAGLEPEPKPNGETDEDEIPDEPIVPKSVRGKVYQLGEHRLMCGDSTDENDVAKLMNGDLAKMVFTDPPWNVAYGSQQNHPSWKPRTILNDKMSTDDFHTFMDKSFRCLAKSSEKGCPTYCVMSA